MTIPALILCGGLGTRLANSLPNTPKGLAPINQKPFLDIQIQWLESQGITDIILAIGHKAEQIKNHYKKHPPKIATIRFSEESSPLGTGGAIVNALNLIKAPIFFVLNGDSFCHVPLRTLYQDHIKSQSDITISITPLKDTSRYGTVIITKDNKIITFKEKNDSKTAGYINTGIYCIRHDFISKYQESTIPLSLEKDILEKAFQTQSITATAFISNSPFIDIGTPESLELASHFQFETPQKHQKLTIISQLFYPELISTGQSLTELAEALSDSGLDLSVWCANPSIIKMPRPPKKIIHHNIIITRVPSTSFPKLSFIGKLTNHLTFSISVFFKLIFSNETHPLLIPTNPPFLATVVCMANLFKKRQIHYAIYDVYPDTAIKCNVIKKDGLIASIWNALNKWIWKQVTTIIVIGKCMEALIKQQSPSSIHGKIHYIPLWVDADTITPVPKTQNHLINDWNLQGKFNVLYAGNMGLFHDMTPFLESAKQCQQLAPDITFIFVGDGQKKKEITTYISKNNLTNCQVHGYVDRDDLKNSLSIADIGLVSLLPSFKGLSIPSKTLSLMAVGCPVIALLPQNSEMTEILESTHSGIVITNSDAKMITTTILDLKNNPIISQTLSKNGLHAATTVYNRKKIAGLYKSLILDYTKDRVTQ